MQIHKYLIGLVVGVLIMLAFFTKEPGTIYTPKVYIRRTVEANPDTLPQAGVDTVLVAHATAQGRVDTVRYEIPVWHYKFDDSLPFCYDHQIIQHQFRLHVWGYVNRYDLESQAQVINLDPVINKKITMWKVGAIGFGVVALALTAKILLD